VHRVQGSSQREMDRTQQSLKETLQDLERVKQAKADLQRKVGILKQVLLTGFFYSPMRAIRHPIMPLSQRLVLIDVLNQVRR